MTRSTGADLGTALSDEAWMRRALELAERGRTTASPNPMVGCVLVFGGEPVGEGFHRRAGEDHAEIAALADAGPDAAGATAYVSLEPCNHTGRTGPCADALLAAGVARVVAAAADPASPGGAERLRRAGVAVDIGVLEAEARRQNEAFFHSVETGLPFVTVKAAVSLDGRIAAADGTSQWITGEVARRHAHELRAEADAVVVGSGTVAADNPALTCRLPGYDGRQPLRAVLDGHGRTRPDRRVCDSQAPTVVFVGPAAPPEAVSALEAAGVEVVRLPAGPSGGVDLPAALAALSSREVRSVLVEGGSGIVTSILAAGLWQKLVLHVAPLLLGDDGRPLLERGAVATLSQAPRFRVDAVTRAGDDVVITLYPRGR